MLPLLFIIAAVIGAIFFLVRRNGKEGVDETVEVGLYRMQMSHLITSRQNACLWLTPPLYPHRMTSGAMPV